MLVLVCGAVRRPIHVASNKIIVWYSKKETKKKPRVQDTSRTLVLDSPCFAPCCISVPHVLVVYSKIISKNF